MIKKQDFIKVVSLFTVLVLTFSGFWVKEKIENKEYKLLAEEQHTKNFKQLKRGINNISLGLEKAIYVKSGEKINVLSLEIFGEAEIAKKSLESLCNKNISKSVIYRFLSQTGNCFANLNGDEIEIQNQDEIKTLLDISEIMRDTVNECDNYEQFEALIVERVEVNKLKTLEDETNQYIANVSFEPYCDQNLNKQPLMTANAKEYTKNMALKVAHSVSNTNLKFKNMQKGKIECYKFASDNVTVTVSKNGGFVVCMQKNRKINKKQISYDEVLKKAKQFLRDMDFKNMADAYYFIKDGICVINFVYLDENTLCYTDLIKVGVAMDTGEIISLDTSAYLTNHTLRAFSEPEFTVEQAKEHISDELRIKATSVALIPTNKGAEVRCYEFLCEGEEGREYLIYINMRTLEIDEIYVLIRTENGIIIK